MTAWLISLAVLGLGSEGPNDNGTSRAAKGEPPLAIAPFDPAKAKDLQARWAEHLKTKPVIENSIGMKLALIPPGEFPMGSPDSDPVAERDEWPRHRVRITKPFYLGVYEVTQAEWKSVMGTEPWANAPVDWVREGVRYPATFVSWEATAAFCRKLTERERRAGRLGSKEEYRLPTEAEWEYACRAGTTTQYHFGDSAESLGDYAWLDGNALDAGKNRAHEVGRKRANAWGLYDVHGNVAEWCFDWHDAKYYGKSPAANPRGPARGSLRVHRGGSFLDGPAICRSACREAMFPDAVSTIGFRVVRSVGE